MPNIINEIKLDFKDVLLRPKRSTLRSRADVDLFREIKFRNSKQSYKGIPVIASNMDTVGTFEMAKALSKHGLFTTIHKYYSLEEWKEFAENNPECLRYVAASSGTGQGDFERLSQILIEIPGVTYICLDVANGYSQHFVEYVRKVRATFPSHTIIAGNVVTGEMVEELILSGADIVKVGIGPGSVCTTRIKTGVGFPQLSAVLECADAAHGLQGHIISDGGCTCPGDVAKAFGAGADFVMAGGMFAGHDQCGGEMMERNGKKYKLFYGMSSTTAMEKHAGGVAEYRSSEGRTVEVLYRGDVEGTVLDILGGLRSACTYTGASKLKELPRRATFIRCTQQANVMYSQLEEDTMASTWSLNDLIEVLVKIKAVSEPSIHQLEFEDITFPAPCDEVLAYIQSRIAYTKPTDSRVLDKVTTITLGPILKADQEKKLQVAAQVTKSQTAKKSPGASLSQEANDSYMPRIVELLEQIVRNQESLYKQLSTVNIATSSVTTPPRIYWSDEVADI